jgi:hypothetical protein
VTVERYVEVVPQSNDAVPAQLPLERGPGNFLLVQTSSQPVTVTLFFDGVRELYQNVSGGIYIRRVKPWANLRIDGPIGTQVTFFHGNEVTDKDETDIRLQIATITGTTLVNVAPATTLNPTATVNVLSGASAQVAANPNRRRITISAPDNNPGFIYVQTHGALQARQGVPIGPGGSYVVNGTYTFDVRNDNAAAQNFSTYEEL